ASKTTRAATTRAVARVTESIFEELEGRQLFSALTLTVNGTAGADFIRLTQSGNFLTVVVNNLHKNYPAGKYADVVVNGLAGNDRISASSSFCKPLTLNGDTG